MSMLDRIMARAEAIKTEKKQPAKQRVRVTWDSAGRIQWPEKKAAAATRIILPVEQLAHTQGGDCPHCGGTGRYLIHTKRVREKCYRCDGKGTLDARDIAFLQRRLTGAGPVCRVAGF